MRRQKKTTSLRSRLIVSLLCLAAGASASFGQAPWCRNPFDCDPDNPLSACYKPPSPPNKCEPRQCGKCQKSPCFVGSGVYASEANDLRIPTNGFPLEVSRFYDSSHVIDGPTGPGWTSNFAAHLYYTTYLLAAPATVIREADITLPNGTRYRFSENPDGSFTPPLGRYDTLHRNGDGSFDLTLQRTMSVLHFDVGGSLTTMTDDYGNQLVFTYDGNGRLERVADASGSSRYIDVYWGADGRISNLVDHTGRQIGYTYNSNGMLTGESNPLNQVTAYAYVAGPFAPLLSEIDDNWGRVITQVTYDTQGRTKTYSENGETYTYTYAYQNSASKTQKKDSQGRAWVYTYGADGLVTSEVAPDGLGTIARSYSADGSIASRTNEVGVTTAYTYDDHGRVLTETRDAGEQSGVRFSFQYDSDFPDSIKLVRPEVPSTGLVDSQWQGKYFEYQSASDPAPGALKRIWTVESDGSTRDLATEIESDASGRVTRLTDPSGSSFEYIYDAAGNVVSILKPSDNDQGGRPTYSFTYDSLGQIVAAFDPLGRSVNVSYDALGRIVSVIEGPPLESSSEFVWTFTYDDFDSSHGLLFVSVADPNGEIHRDGYDQFGHLVTQEDEAGATTRYSYSHGQLVGITDGNGNFTSYSYDVRRRLSSTTFPDGASESYSYYADGRLHQYSSRTGETTTFSYDHFGRLAKKDFTGGSSLTFLYGGESLVQTVDTRLAPSDIHTYSYDNRYRLSSETEGNRGTLHYYYDDASRVDHFQIEGGPTTNYSYYPDGRVRTISWSEASGEFLYSYALDGQVSRISYPNGLVSNFEYDNLGRRVLVENLGVGGSVLSSFRQEFDRDWDSQTANLLGVKSTVVTSVPSLGLDAAETRFHYDSSYQLSRADYPSGSAYHGEQDSWSYDQIGNRLTYTSPLGTSSYSYKKFQGNPLNSPILESDGSRTFSFDSAGRATGWSRPGGAVSLTWDAEDRLVAIDDGRLTTMGYDFRGRRTSIHDSTGETSFLYAGTQLVAERAGEATRYFLGGPRVDSPLSMSDASGIYYFLLDGMNSVSCVTNGAGQVISSYAYDAWGEVRAAVEGLPSPFQFTSREPGPAGLQYQRARWLDRALGRFVSEDPKRFQADINLYRYARNSPVRFRDPFGLKCFDVVWHGHWFLYAVLDMGVTPWLPVGEADEEPQESHPTPVVEPPEGLKGGGSGSGGPMGLPWVEVHCLWRRWLYVTGEFHRKSLTDRWCTCPLRLVSRTPGLDVKESTERRKQEKETSEINIYGWEECPDPNEPEI